MSEDFLKRWSRRKREVAEQNAVVPEQSDVAAARNPDDHAGQTKPDHPPATDSDSSGLPFDLSKLPSIESIGPATDIRIFMQPGVPAALTRAALRRAWSADPAIRDYIGLSENSWDFTAPGSMTGFGSIDPKDVARLLSNIISSNEPDKDKPSAGDEAQPDTGAAPAGDVAPDSVNEPVFDAVADAGKAVPVGGMAEASHTDVAVREEHFGAAQHLSAPMLQSKQAPIVTQSSEPPPIPLRRPHGRALPE